MGLLGNKLFDIINGGGVLPKLLPTITAVKVAQSIKEKAFKKFISKFKIIDSTSTIEYGDIIGVRRRAGYKHFGVYVDDYCIIHYASRSGDFGKDICIHDTTLEKFLNGANTYFICKFPKIYGKPSEIDIQSALSGFSSLPQWVNLFKFLKGCKYRLYSPEDTVQRAFGKLGERKYNLAINNCEHFAIWCKTGISESHQLNDLLDILLMHQIYT